MHKLKEKKLKITPQRIAIVEALLKQKDLHPGAGAIYMETKKKIKGMSLSTVYATLNELARCDVIKILQFDKTENRCEGNLEKHVNLVCLGCKKIMDYTVPVSIQPEEIAQKTGFNLTGTRLEYYGYCRECGKEKLRKSKH